MRHCSDSRPGQASYSPSGSDQAGRAYAASNGIAGRGHWPVTIQVSTGAGTGPWTGRVNASTSALSHDDINPGYRGAGLTHDGSAWRRCRRFAGPSGSADLPKFAFLALRLWPAVR